MRSDPPLTVTTILGFLLSPPTNALPNLVCWPSPSVLYPSSGSITGRLRACARSSATKPSGRWPGGVSANLVLIVELVWLSLEIVEKPWSEVTMISVVSSRPSSLRAERIRARLSSALRIAASDVGPLMPGTSMFKLSP